MGLFSSKPTTAKQVKQQIEKRGKSAPKAVQGLIKKHASKIKPSDPITKALQVQAAMEKELTKQIKVALSNATKDEAKKLANQERRSQHRREIDAQWAAERRKYEEMQAWWRRQPGNS